MAFLNRLYQMHSTDCLSLDDPLFVGRGNQLVPKDFAAKIADPLREELNRIENPLTPEDSFDPKTAKGCFLILASDFFSELLMPQLADHLSKTAPNIVVQMVGLVPGSNVASIERYIADIALTRESGFPDWINREPLFRSSFSVIAQKEIPRPARPDHRNLAQKI